MRAGLQISGRAGLGGRLRRARRGASLTGYALVVGLIAVVAIAATTRVGEEVTELFGLVGEDLDSVADGAGPGGSGSGETPNQPPVASADPAAGSEAAFTTDEDTAFTTGDVLANDSDPDTGDTLSVTSFDASGTTGAVTDNGDGTFDYDPDGQFESLDDGDTATDSFTYTVSDGTDTDSATVTITIDGVDEPPVLAGFGTTCPSNPDPVADIGCTDSPGNPDEAIYAGEIGGDPPKDPAIYIAPDDETAGGTYLAWSPGSSNASAGNSTTDGDSNMATFSPISDFEAAEACNSKSGASWFLPAREELQGVWDNLVEPFVVDGLVSTPIGTEPGDDPVPPGSDLAALNFDFDGNSGDGRYWSSSENTSTGAWDLRFAVGNQSSFTVSKFNTLSVRCVRR